MYTKENNMADRELIELIEQLELIGNVISMLDDNLGQLVATNKRIADRLDSMEVSYITKEEA